MSEQFSLVEHISDINAEQWNSLAQGHPMLRHEFFVALQETGCASAQTGWSPHFLTLHRNGDLAAAMPLYLKYHSRGEYVFDMAWARAFAEHGLRYYPKLLSAVPFTPVPGPRLLARNHEDRVLLARQAIELAAQNELSSLHVLFPMETDMAALREAGFIFRESIQFHWHNSNYRDMDDFLSRFNQKNRKKLKQDRKRSLQAGVTFRWISGDDINDDTLEFFYACYVRTYFEHGNPPYLNMEFFQHLVAAMPEHLVFVVAYQENAPIACALNIQSEDALYGRYWGATKFISGLHFETCYMQAIEYCIAKGLNRFEGGAQGEHKLARGMLPVRTYSAHWIRDARYAQAIADFLERETVAIDEYADILEEHSPFKKTPGNPVGVT
ncbi:MAG TPA: GNAT family N-acetyltransferase [Pusillimonas sp.]|uniref:GNAT family N-acetyltransferase n=1 Tax=Pusillimonas sp. TaxID=3040095 RepID=UPI002B4AE9A8|nr:GNAT family N-acetyltransferase [Pusillimonas sp.]HLU20141.1 GNAT family N-acetyltransferase [Pusillimonas sp.]